MKCLSEVQRQIVAFIPRLRGSRAMAQLGTRWSTSPPAPPDRLRAVWTPEGRIDEGGAEGKFGRCIE